MGAEPIVAVGLIDSWAEAVPRRRQRTTAVFGFNAPAARPPQAILLAVPPDLTAGPGAALDTAGLIQILSRKRVSSRTPARPMPSSSAAYLAAVPAAMFGGTGRTSVSLRSEHDIPFMTRDGAS